MRIRELDAGSAGAWDRFVRDAPGGTFFHLGAWAQVIRHAFGHPTHYAFAEQDGSIVGVLPLARMRTWLFGDMLVSTPFCVYGGAVAATDEAASALQAHAEALMRRTGVPCLEFREQHATIPGWAERPALHYTFRKAITGDADADMKAIPRKQRAMVRKGIQGGLRADTACGPDAADRLHRIYAESVRNLGSPVFSRRYFRALTEFFPDEHDVLTVLHEDRPVAAVLNFTFRDQVMPYYGGGTHQARHLAANDFMYWEVMRQAGQGGARLFDFGRSKANTGAFSFKRNWGFAAEPLHYSYRLRDGAPLPENNPSNPKFARMIAVWKRLPMPIANLIGPHISRGLG